MQDFSAFKEAMKQDTLANEMGRYLSEQDTGSEEALLKAIVDFAATKGYTFTEKDLIAEATKSRKLDDDELENVAGGFDILALIDSIRGTISDWISNSFYGGKQKF